MGKLGMTCSPRDPEFVGSNSAEIEVCSNACSEELVDTDQG